MPAMCCIFPVHRFHGIVINLPLYKKKNTRGQLVLSDHYLRHIGIYAYRAGFIKQYIQWQPSALEQIESLEQLRVLWYGEKSM